jgi:hypothetical protein
MRKCQNKYMDFDLMAIFHSTGYAEICLVVDLFDCVIPIKIIIMELISLGCTKAGKSKNTVFAQDGPICFTIIPHC